MTTHDVIINSFDISEKIMANKTPISLITLILNELKLQFEEDLSPDDPKLTLINTITPEQFYSSGVIKSNSKARIKSLICEYITNYVHMRCSKTRSQSGTDLLTVLRKDAGMLSKPREEEIQTQLSKETITPTRPTEIIMTQNQPTTSNNTETDDTFDDELEDDPNQTELSRKYPALPRTPCPKNLFIGNMHYSYLNSLYTTDRHSYPKKWNNLKNNDPDQAWNSLNQTMIPFLNTRWKNQGVHFEVGETPVDSMSYHDLKSSIIKTITDAQASRGGSSTPMPSLGSVPNIGSNSILRLEKSISRIEEAARVLTSHTTKVTGRETSSSAPPTQSQPQLSGIPSTSGPQKRPFESDSEEENESVEQYAFKLKKMATNCEFANLCDDLIRDRIICGIRDNALRERLLREPDLTLQKALNICNIAQISKVQAGTINNVHDINKCDYENKNHECDAIWRSRSAGAAAAFYI